MKAKEIIKEFNETTYKEYLANPKEYKSKCKNDSHIEYLEKEFPQKLKWSDEEIYQDQIKYEEEKDIGENGEVYSRYNPNSKWDWFDIGGRYRNKLLTKLENNDTFEHNSFAEHMVGKDFIKDSPEGYKWVNGARIKDVDFKLMEQLSDEKFYPWAFIDEDGWHEQGKMGWWAMNDATEDSINSFIEKFQEYINNPNNQDKYIVIVDCHI